MKLNKFQKKHIGERTGEYRKIVKCVGVKRNSEGKNKSVYKWICLNCGNTGEDVYPNIKARKGKCKNCSDKGGSGARKDWVGSRQHNRVVTGVASLGRKENKNTQYTWECDKGHVGTSRVESLRKGGCGVCSRQKATYAYSSELIGRRLGERTITNVGIVKGARTYYLLCGKGHETTGHHYYDIAKTKCPKCKKPKKKDSSASDWNDPNNWRDPDKQPNDWTIYNGRGLLESIGNRISTYKAKHICLHCGKIKVTSYESFQKTGCGCNYHIKHCNNRYEGVGEHCTAPEEIVKMLESFTVFGVRMLPLEMRDVFGIDLDLLCHKTMSLALRNKKNGTNHVFDLEGFIKKEIGKQVKEKK